MPSLSRRRSLEGMKTTSEPNRLPPGVKDEEFAFEDMADYGFDFEYLSMSMSMPMNENPHTDTGSTSVCLARSCSHDYKLCVDHPDCSSYLSECLETGEHSSEMCQQYRAKAWVEVKFLVYCYDEHCDGDGTQLEREKLQEELLQEWDPETDVCVDHPNNWYSCADNMHCLHDSGEDSWCSSDDARVMCRDCAGPGQKCEESDICHDELFFCDVLSEEEKMALDPTHPCVIDSCAVSRHSQGCLDAVFEHCCDPALESCKRTDPSTCSSAGCSRFTDPNSYHQIVNYDVANCPFNDANATCAHESCNDPDMFREIVDFFLGDDTGDCHGNPWCFKRLMMETCPAYAEVGAANTTRRQLQDALHYGRRSLWSTSMTGQSLFLSIHMQMNLPTFDMHQLGHSHRPDRRLRGYANQRLEEVVEGETSKDPGECLLQFCYDEFNACDQNADCAYLMENCTNPDSSPLDCSLKDAALFQPLEECYIQHCSFDPMIQCFHDSCPTALQNCLDDVDCSFVMENCADTDGYYSEECDQKSNSAATAFAPLEQCHAQMCNDDALCVKESCPDILKTCMDIEDCEYVLFNCLSDDPEEQGDGCSTRFSDEVKTIIDSIMQCHTRHCSDDLIVQCLYHDCETQMYSCHQDTECHYVLENCMDEHAAADCEDKFAMENTQALFGSIEECYMDKCSHLDEQNEFMQDLEEARQCLDREDGCAWAREACEADEACSGPLSELFQCKTGDPCASSVIEQGFEVKSFTDMINCLGRECGIGGDDGDNTPDMNTREECAAVLSNYCSVNPDEKACQTKCPYGCKTGDFCPCTNEACQSVYAAPMCSRLSGPCLEYSEKLKHLYLSAGYYQPRDEWNRERLANFLMDPPPDDLDILANLSPELQVLREQCNTVQANLADNINMCMKPSINFCNTNGWDQGCRTDLSTCGDGIVTYHESCDDGNEFDGDGCSSWCYPEHNFICPNQNEQCEQCIRDERADWGDAKVCKFCVNERVSVSSPCFAPECQSIEDFDSAKACDDHVEKFCSATADAGLRDLGCDAWEKKSQMYTIPTVLNKCTYKIKSFNLNSKDIHEVKLAVFTCLFDDPHDILNDTTPLFRYRHPYDYLSDDEQNVLSPSALQILDTMLESREEKLIPLKELRLDDFFPYVHPALATDEGHPIHIHNPLARLVIYNEEPPEQERFDAWGNLICHHDQGEYRDLYHLPPVDEPLRMGLKAFLLKKRWEAMNNPYGDEEKSEFLFDVNEIDAAESRPRLNGTAIFGIKLSTTWKSHHLGHVEERENKEWICKDWSNWQDMENNPDCSTVEDSIKNGLARIKFEESLFQSGCVDDDCDLKVDHCREVGLAPQSLDVDAEDFHRTAVEVLSEVQKIDDAESWPSLVEKFIRVSAAASSTSYDDAMRLFNKLVVRGKKTKYMKDVPDYCEYNYYSDEWLADPCCNWELRQYQCCAPKDIPSGEIDVVLGINREQVSTYCQSASEVENLLQDLMTNIDNARSCSESLESGVSINIWEETWQVKDTCNKKIYDAESLECEKDSDCSHCSQSTCRIKSGSTSGACTVPYDDTEGCMLECLSNEMDPELLRYLKEEWEVAATADDAVFRQAFVERITEPGCSGGRAWEEDIGRNGYEWQCNSTCLADNICDDYDYSEYLQRSSNGGHHGWIDFSNEEVCASYNGTLGLWGQCEFESLVTAPCKLERKCHEECQKPHSPTGCAEMNGTWVQNPGEMHGRCCPPDTYVIYDASRNEKVCSYVPEGSPKSWELRSPACCAAENGDWKEIDSNGQCCLGKWMSYFYEGKSHQWCQTETWGWDMSDCYRKCNVLRKDCQQCQVDKGECCGLAYKSANQTACESYTDCTDSSIWEGSGRTCDDPTPFCSRCHGRHCYRTGQEPACIVNIEEYECKGDLGLPGISTEWDVEWNRCKVVNNSSIAPGWSCFGSDFDMVCPNPTDFPWNHKIDGLVPQHQWGESTCDRGCYIPTLTNRTSCEAASNYGAQKYYYWDERGGNGGGICRAYHAKSESECEGVWVPHSLSFNTGRFSNEEQCNEGECSGLGWGGWSREQCMTSGRFSCTRSCPRCVSWSWPFSSQGHGACFSSNMTTCMNEGASQIPCVIESVSSESDCDATNELDAEWKTCSAYTSDSVCNNQDSLDPYVEIMGCSWHWEQCDSEEECEAAGECDDWENQREICLDPGWEHGDKCWAATTEDTDPETQQVTSTYEFSSCNDCRHLDGVCVEPRSDRGCEEGKWHRLGCRLYGLYAKDACTSANSTYNWYTRAKTKEECFEMKGCKEPGRGGISELPPDQCFQCGGELKPLFQWHGGAWVQPQVQDLTWMSEGATIAPVNEWKPVIAEYKLEKELAIPMIKRFAKKKQTQALTMFNVFTAALEKLTCACGSGGNRTNCFDSIEGSVSGVSKAFCGLDEPIEAACGTAIVEKTCQTEQQRRLSEGYNISDSMDIVWAHHSVGSHSRCFEPFSSAEERVLQNPLVVKNANGVVIGQLLGDGKGMSSTGDFEAIELCLELRVDIQEWDTLFTELDIGVADNGVIVPLYNTKWTAKDGAKVCFKVKSDGVYFPILRSNSSWTDLNSFDVDASCDERNGIKTYNATSGTVVCVCHCGFFGEDCGLGCLNSCSLNGQCIDGSCVCNATRTGIDCSAYDCPIGLLGKRCSGRGLCQENASCLCEENFSGEACSENKIVPQQVAIPPSFDEFQGPETESPTFEPSPRPSKSPSPEPSPQSSNKLSKSPSKPPSKTDESTLTKKPSSESSSAPTNRVKTSNPSKRPSPRPSPSDSSEPSSSSSSAPSTSPSLSGTPSLMPSIVSAAPTPIPSNNQIDPTAKPTRPESLQPPPVPAPQSTCIEDECEAKLQECFAGGFDSCACVPGLLKCVSRLCEDDLEEAMDSCETIASASNTCELECVPRPFPTANAAKLELKVKAKIEIDSISVEDFLNNLLEPFKIAVTDPLPNSEPEDVQDVFATAKGTSNGGGRHLRELEEEGINVDFSIAIDNQNDLVETQNKLLDAVEGEVDENGNDKPSVFAQAMEDRGVIANATQLTVSEAKTEVIVVSADDEDDFIEEEEEKSFLEKNAAVFYGCIGGLVVLIVVCSYFACCRGDKQQISPRVVFMTDKK